MELYGELIIRCVDKNTKKTVYTEKIKNTICNNLYDKIVKLLADSTDMDHRIAKIQVGVGTAVPLPTDEALASPITPLIDGVVFGNTITFTNPTDYVLQIVGVLTWQWGNGFAICEAGLLTDDNTLVARTTFSKKMKSNAYNFTFTWTITTKQ